MKRVGYIVLTLIMCLSICASANSSGNIMNGSLIDYSGDEIFISQYKGLKVFNTATEKFSTIYDDFSLGTINYKDGYILSNVTEIGTRRKNLGSYRLKSDGKQMQRVDNLFLNSVNLYQNKIFGLNELGNLISLNIDGSDYRVELDGIYYCLSIVGDYLYLGGEKIIRMHIPSKIIQTVCDCRIYPLGKMIVSGDYIYYLVYIMDDELNKNVDKIYRTKVDGTGEQELIVNCVSGSWNVGKELIYYVNDNNLFKVPIAGGESSLFFPDAKLEDDNMQYNSVNTISRYEDIYLTDSHIVILDNSYSGRLRIYKLDGKKVIDQIQQYSFY